MNEKLFLLKQLKEHTKDSDYARNQHFWEECKYRKIGKIFNTVKTLVFLSTIVYYMTIANKQSNNIVFMLGISLSVLAIVLEVVSYILGFSQKAEMHWKSAQVYTGIYRTCQFFCSNNHPYSSDVWREKLHDISDDLCRISLLSPALSQLSYKKANKEIKDKVYPVDELIFTDDSEHLEKVMNDIKKIFNKREIEVYIFGSYISNNGYKDIDIAIIYHGDNSEMYYTEKLDEIESHFLIYGLELDISLVMKKELINGVYNQYIDNIKMGDCYYKSNDIISESMSLGEWTVNTNIIKEYLEKALDEESQNYDFFVTYAFYTYYYMMAYVLHFYQICWDGEKSLLNKCDKFISSYEGELILEISKEEYKQLIRHARLFYRKKNSLFLASLKNDLDTIEFMKNIFQEDENILKSIISQN